jgi:hypothetical protein
MNRKLLIIALSAAILTGAAGCEAAWVSSQPADVAYEQGVAPGDGYIWIDGDWAWSGGAYVWHAGHWGRPRAGHTWAAGHWEHGARGYRWHRGGWR